MEAWAMLHEVILSVGITTSAPNLVKPEVRPFFCLCERSESRVDCVTASRRVMQVARNEDRTVCPLSHRLKLGRKTAPRCRGLPY